MCGITGFVDHDMRMGRRRDLEEATLSLRHRGPNDIGFWSDDECTGLGHTRLSILDLSPLGHQPMVSRDGNWVMVFNGEVYNHVAIRRELEACGDVFAGHSDSEVVLASLIRWGRDAVHRFIGMFAIALWSRVDKRLLLLRDRLGVKPLYYGWDGNTLWFGSELKALRKYRHWIPTIDQPALCEYFQFGYINAPRSIYRQVFKLPPGFALELDKGGAPRLRRYWSVLDALDKPYEENEADAADHLRTLLSDAFELRMVSDVPVGVFLSGGIDSSLVAAVLQQAAVRTLHTFTIGMTSDAFNEMPHANKIATHLGTRHTEQLLQATRARDLLREWSSLFDEPFFDSSGIPTLLVSRLAGLHVKVVLSADGGDELFSGYNVYTSVLDKLKKRDAYPRSVRNAVSSLLQAWPGQTSGTEKSLSSHTATGGIARLRTLHRLLGATPATLYEHAISIWKPDELHGLLGYYEPVRERIDAYPGTVADQMSLWDMHNYLPGDILVKVDRTTMRAGIEGREPLLDHRVAEFAFALPLEFRRGGLGGKHILKRVLYEHIPRELLDRPKQGFAIPLADWLRGELNDLLDEHLSRQDIDADGIFDPNVVERIKVDFRKGKLALTNKVWSLLAFQMWRKAWN